MTQPLPVFPFTALVGQDALRQALLWLAVDPRIGGVLLSGPRGSAKTTSARALADLLPTGRFVNLPLGATEEQLVGTLDLDAALAEQRVQFREGLLARAHGGVLYVDEVNLLPDALVDLLLDVSASGVNHVERDGISHSHPAQIALIGTMNPEEGELRPQLLDRFGLCVSLGDTLALETRQAIVRARLAFDADPPGFLAREADATAQLAAQITAARERLDAIPFSEANHATVADLCHAAQVEGVRADLVMLRAARARAALAARNAIDDEDIHAVAEPVLAHRRREQGEGQAPSGQNPEPQTQEQTQGQALNDHAGQTQGQALDDPGTQTQGQAPDNATDDWGAMPPQPVPIAGVKAVRPLQPKKP